MKRTLITTRARALRKAMSEPEVMLWTRLRSRSENKPTFRRQHPFGSIILDFYCPSARLAVEVDGATHWTDEMRHRDAARDHWLGTQGVSVLRIPAAMIYRDLTGVADAILRRAEAERLRLAPLHPPLFAALGGRSPSRRYAGEVVRRALSEEGALVRSSRRPRG